MLPLVDYCRRLNCHLQATFCIAAAGGIHSSITQQSGPIHVVITSRRSYDDARSVAGRNAVLAGNGSDVLARSLVSAHCTVRLTSWSAALKCASVSLTSALPRQIIDGLTPYRRRRRQITSTAATKPKVAQYIRCRRNNNYHIIHEGKVADVTRVKGMVITMSNKKT